MIGFDISTGMTRFTRVSSSAASDVYNRHVYRSVYGQPSPEHNILLIREYEVDRKYVPQSVELLAEVEAIGKDEDTKILGLYPIIADKMDTLFVIYYYSSFESMGDIIDRIGMSEAFQNVVSKANEIGKLKASNVVRMI